LDLMRAGLVAALAALLLAACAPLPPAAPEPRRLSGVLTGETVLSGEVLLDDDLLVPPGSTLVLRPGTVVRVRAAEGTKIDPEYLSPATELLVRGTLRIEGTAERPVRFVPEAPAAGNEPVWAGIELDGATDSVVAGAEIERAETGVLCIASSPLLQNNQMRGCRYGIIAQQGSAPKILDTRIEDGEGGVFCWLGSNPWLKGNRIAGHAEEGVFVDATSRPWLDRNIVTGNTIGLALFHHDLPYDPTGIRGNGEDVRFLGVDGGDG
jgi:hypothetical protein